MLVSFSILQAQDVIYASGGGTYPITFTINPVDLTGTEIGPNNTYGNITEITAFSSDLLYGTVGLGSSNTSKLVTINTTTGNVNLIGDISTNGMVKGLEFVGAILYGAFTNSSDGTIWLVKIDRWTAIMTTVNQIFDGTQSFDHISGMAYDRSSATMYGLGIQQFGGDERLMTIDLITGVPSVMANQVLTTENACRGLTIGPNRVLYTGTHSWGDLPGHLISINKNTGIGTVLGPTISTSISGLAYLYLTVIPLSNWALGIGLLLIGAFIVIRYRRKLAVG